MANTVKAYKNLNGNYILDCGELYEEKIQFLITENGVTRLIDDLIINDFSAMEEVYFDSFLLAALDNAYKSSFTKRCTIDEVEALIILVQEKVEDFD